MLYTKRSSFSPDQLDQRLRDSAQKHKFGILNVQDLQATLKSKGIDFPNSVRVYDVCNPQAAAQALTHDLRVSTVLPCRISITSSGNGAEISTVRPTTLLQVTGVEGTEATAQSVERDIIAIIDEAAG